MHDDAPWRDKTLSEDQVRVLVIRQVDRLILKLLGLLPDECLLKVRRELTRDMILLLDERLIESGLLKQQDICALCPNTICPWNSRVSFPRLRPYKVLLLIRVFSNPVVSWFKQSAIKSEKDFP